MAYVIDKKNGVCRRYLLQRYRITKIMCAKCQTTTNACNILKIEFFFQISMESFETNQPPSGWAF